MYKKYIKRILDIIISFMAIMILLPILLTTAILVYVNLGKPILFKQKRPGYKGEIFSIYKFRTMKNIEDDAGVLLSDEERLTKFGRFLRASSLDELPEFWNVLIGEMSLVGPRPLLPEYLEYYTIEELRRHDLRPGLTGWAQINGRNVTKWEERLQQDIHYVDNCTFLFDFKIVIKTVSKVIKKSDIIVGNQHGKTCGRLDKIRCKRKIIDEESFNSR